MMAPNAPRQVLAQALHFSKDFQPKRDQMRAGVMADTRRHADGERAPFRRHEIDCALQRWADDGRWMVSGRTRVMLW